VHDDPRTPARIALPSGAKKRSCLASGRAPSTLVHELVTPLVVLLAALLLVGCTREVRLYAPPAMIGGLFVRVYEAEVQGKQVRVKMVLENHTRDTVHVDRDGMALKLPDGRVLPRAAGRHNVYSVPPGDEQTVHVDFRAGEDLRYLAGASLIVGGIRYGSDAYPRAIGEVPLSTDMRVLQYAVGGPPPPTSVAAVPPSPRDATPRAEPAATRTDAGPNAGAATVSVDVTTLDDAAFQRLDGAALEKQIVVRLVQDGFAVVATSWQPAVVLTVHSLGQSVLLQAYGPAGLHRREVAAEVGGRRVPSAELRLELAQKAAELVRAALGPQQGPTRSL
jgi:hypothetical protein